MKTNKVVPLCAALLLTACGHGFEGQYDVSVENAFLEMMGQKPASTGERMTIGRDYVIINGDRSDAEISVRKIGDKRYLVLNHGPSEEELFEIIDKRTLSVQDGLNVVTLTRS